MSDAPDPASLKQVGAVISGVVERDAATRLQATTALASVLANPPDGLVARLKQAGIDPKSLAQADQAQLASVAQEAGKEFADEALGVRYIVGRTLDPGHPLSPNCRCDTPRRVEAP